MLEFFQNGFPVFRNGLSVTLAAFLSAPLSLRWIATESKKLKWSFLGCLLHLSDIFTLIHFFLLFGLLSLNLVILNFNFCLFFFSLSKPPRVSVDYCGDTHLAPETKTPVGTIPGHISSVSALSLSESLSSRSEGSGNLCSMFYGTAHKEC